MDYFRPIMMIKKITIGSLELKNNLFLSPMAGITNGAFRLLCLEGGAGLAGSEMVSSESIKYANKKSFKMLDILPGEHPIAIQIFGADPRAMAYAAALVQEAGADIVDINASCPVKKILRSGSGAMLMKNPLVLADIISSVKKKVKIPVTVKFRVGFTERENLSVSLAKIAEDAGADAVAVHGRPVSRMHAGNIDLDALNKTALAVGIPVIGNGGIANAEGAGAILSAGCAAASIGRAAVSNPRIFSEIKAELEGKQSKVADANEKIKMFIRFLVLNSEIYGETHGIVRARKLVGYWLKGLRGGAELRGRFMEMKNLNEARALLLQYIADNENRANI